MNMITTTAAMTSTAAAVGARPLAQDDPIFAAIEEHKKAYAALGAHLTYESELDAELPSHLTQSSSNYYDGEKIVETDDPRWIASIKETERLSVAETEATIALINVELTTLAGAAALTRYIADQEWLGNQWPRGLVDPEDERIKKCGRSWEYFLHRNLAKVLEQAASAA